jgi:hypothetical protein
MNIHRSPVSTTAEFGPDSVRCFLRSTAVVATSPAMRTLLIDAVTFLRSDVSAHFPRLALSHFKVSSQTPKAQLSIHHASCYICFRALLSLACLHLRSAGRRPSAALHSYFSRVYRLAMSCSTPVLTASLAAGDCGEPLAHSCPSARSACFLSPLLLCRRLVCWLGTVVSPPRTLRTRWGF